MEKYSDLCARAEKHLSNGNFVEAFAALRDAIELDEPAPNAVETYFKAIRLLRENKREAKLVLAWAETLVETTPGNPWGYRFRRIGLDCLGNGETAINDAFEALELDDDHPFSLLDIGWALAGLGAYKEAEDFALQLFEVAPQWHETLSLLGLLALEQGRTEEGEAYYRSALTLVPDAVIPNFNLFVERWRSGRFDEGLIFLDRSLKGDGMTPNFQRKAAGFIERRLWSGRLRPVTAFFMGVAGIVSGWMLYRFFSVPDARLETYWGVQILVCGWMATVWVLERRQVNALPEAVRRAFKKKFRFYRPSVYVLLCLSHVMFLFVLGSLLGVLHIFLPFGLIAILFTLSFLVHFFAIRFMRKEGLSISRKTENGN